jgi:hypothetical protein
MQAIYVPKQEKESGDVLHFKIPAFRNYALQFDFPARTSPFLSPPSVIKLFNFFGLRTFLMTRSSFHCA